MKALSPLLLIIMALVLQGCVTTSYTHNTDGSETFKLTSVMKSVDGLEAKRGDFELSVDETHSQDVTGDIVDILKLSKGIPPGDSNE